MFLDCFQSSNTLSEAILWSYECLLECILSPSFLHLKTGNARFGDRAVLMAVGVAVETFEEAEGVALALQ